MNTTLIRKLIVQNQIRTWQDVYKYTNPTEMSKAFGRSPKHWVTVRKDPMKLTIGDMGKIIEVLKITKKQFLEVVGGGD